jgi:hypothetical protein
VKVLDHVGILRRIVVVNGIRSLLCSLAALLVSCFAAAAAALLDEQF